MTKEEAIIQVCDILYGYDEVPEAMYKNACNRVREIIEQIDKPKLNWTSYCETCSHNSKLLPYCDKCKNHELVPYGWDYDESRESITGA